MQFQIFLIREIGGGNEREAGRGEEVERERKREGEREREVDELKKESN